MADKIAIPWGQVISPSAAMDLAIELGNQGRGFVEPNPPVGCIVVDPEHRVIGAGFHRRFGGPHAEVDALEKIEVAKLSGATVYVTLEPCAHEGKTPSCAKHLSRLPLSKVVYGLRDPNPMVAGQGAAIIQRAGISAEEWAGSKQPLERLAEVFLHNMVRKQAFVAIKVATSLDGQMGLKTGESQWITDEKSREYSHLLRSYYDAVLVGVGTFLQDNPTLNVRHRNFPNKANKVVLVDREGQSFSTLESSKLVEAHLPENIFVVTSDQVQKTPGPWHHLQMKLNSGGEFDLLRLTSWLYQLGIHSLFVEGGAGIFSSFLRQQAWNRTYVFMAPRLIGAQNGQSWTEGFGVKSLNQALSLESPEVEFLGDNWLITGKKA